MVKARSRFKRMYSQDMEDQFGQELGRGTESFAQNLGWCGAKLSLKPHEPSRFDPAKTSSVCAASEAAGGRG